MTTWIRYIVRGGKKPGHIYQNDPDFHGYCWFCGKPEAKHD